MRRLRVAAASLLAALAGAGTTLPQAAAPAPEYQVKAAFLFNFARFVEWPEDAFAGPGSPLVLGVLGADPFGPELDETLRGKTVHGRGLEIRRFARPADVGRCHLLFVGRGELARLRRSLEPLADRGVLIVGDEDGPRVAGVMIRLTREQDRIRFEVDLAAVERARLKISSKLLRVGKVVTAVAAGGD